MERYVLQRKIPEFHKKCNTARQYLAEILPIQQSNANLSKLKMQLTVHAVFTGSAGSSEEMEPEVEVT